MALGLLVTRFKEGLGVERSGEAGQWGRNECNGIGPPVTTGLVSLASHQISFAAFYANIKAALICPEVMEGTPRVMATLGDN
jgi:hypothetical protein